MRRRDELVALLLPIAAVAAIAAALAGAGILLGSLAASRADASPTPPPLAGATPSPSPTATSTPFVFVTPTPPPVLAEHFALTPAAELLEFVRSPDGAIPSTERTGIYFLDVATGGLEGWRLGSADDLAGGYRFSSDNRFVSVLLRQGGVLADRLTGQVYRWQLGPQIVTVSSARVALAMRDGRLLMRMRDTYAILDVDPEPRVSGMFQAEGAYALISPDSRRAIVTGTEPPSEFPPRGFVPAPIAVQLVELDTGRVREIGRMPVPDSAIAPPFFLLQHAHDGAAVLVTATNSLPSGVHTYWQVWTWDGRLVGEGSASGLVHPSNDGTRLAWTAEALSNQGVHFPGVPVVYAVSTRDGSPLFRIVGASTCYNVTAGGRWLADGSGLVVVVPEVATTIAADPDPSRLRSFRGTAVAIARGDGSITWLQVPGYPEVVPSPRRIEHFAAEQGALLIDQQGNVIVSAHATEPGSLMTSIPPWSADGTELRIMAFPTGHGPRCSSWSSMVRPMIEFPPYSDAWTLELFDEAAGSELFSEPRGTEVVGRLQGQLRVTVHEVVGFQAEAPFAPHELWARVTTADGQEGWLELGDYGWSF